MNSRENQVENNKDKNKPIFVDDARYADRIVEVLQEIVDQNEKLRAIHGDSRERE